MELTTKIENLELGQYLTRILAWNHIHTLGHLLTIPKEHLSKLDNLGVKRANYIINVVHEAGFYFKNESEYLKQKRIFSENLNNNYLKKDTWPNTRKTQVKFINLPIWAICIYNDSFGDAFLSFPFKDLLLKDILADDELLKENNDKINNSKDIYAMRKAAIHEAGFYTNVEAEYEALMTKLAKEEVNIDISSISLEEDLAKRLKDIEARQRAIAALIKELTEKSIKLDLEALTILEKMKQKENSPEGRIRTKK